MAEDLRQPGDMRLPDARAYEAPALRELGSLHASTSADGTVVDDALDGST